ncbi:hypothetical protein [Winogradskyella sp. 3972H.M.0a.05]|uniref:hypothetical protein n=1 Tax=Winogradskyella sp. 3972H.M.0a.05 TaxID=2950277 RepID=UPI0033913C3C
MSSNFENASFKKLLNKLQEESWQLELLISGFAIFGLFTAFPVLTAALKEAQNDEKMYAFVIILIAIISCAILIFNLLLHVVLRGLWIGALGLRYVSGDIDYEELRYSEKFTKYLRKKVGSFDKYIANLENYCSIIFAISFLLIFYVLAITMTILCIALIANYILDDRVFISEPYNVIIGLPLLLFVIFGMLMTFVDFVTLGWLKRKKWLSKIYFPFYRVFSFITLAFLYRPIVYNFLDNRFGRRLSLMLVPLYILIIIGSSMRYQRSNYFSRINNSNSIVAFKGNYEDQLIDDGDFIDEVAIPSKVITNSFLKVFVVYDDNIEDNIFDLNPGLKPEKDIRGLRSNMYSSGNFSWRKRDSLRREYIKTFNNNYIVRIDTTDFETEFVLTESLKKQMGFESYVDIEGLSEGKHTVRVYRNRLKGKDTIKSYIAQIPFWYYND